jgi:hypothetical protein
MLGRRFSSQSRLLVMQEVVGPATAPATVDQSGDPIRGEVLQALTGLVTAVEETQESPVQVRGSCFRCARDDEC